jgi:hypothetical protein
MPQKKEIVYPVFLECCQYADDAFWESIFEDLTYGRAPYGTYISKGFLCCSYKNKEFSYKLERKESKILYDDIYKLLTEKLGILSHKEKIRKRLVFNELEKNIRESRQEWSHIRRKNIKDTMYEKYVIEMKHKYSLSVKQCKYLLAVIMVSIMFKTITTKDITFKDDKIQNILGIDFAKGKVILKRPLCNSLEVQTETPDITESKLMSDNWEKYLKTLRTN